MSSFPLYNALREIGISKDKAQEVVDNVATTKDVVTKEYLQAELSKLEMRLMNSINNKLYAHTLFIIAVVGLMIKFL